MSEPMDDESTAYRDSMMGLINHQFERVFGEPAEKRVIPQGPIQHKSQGNLTLSQSIAELEDGI
jgi:hypothetical protein